MSENIESRVTFEDNNSVPSYTPNVSTNNTELKNKLENTFDEFNKKMDATLGMISISLKEYRDTFDQTSLYEEERIVRTTREDRFFEATDTLKQNIIDLSSNIKSIVKLIDDKNKEQDVAIQSMTGSINSSLDKVNSSANENLDNYMPIGSMICLPYSIQESRDNGLIDQTTIDNLKSRWLRCDGNPIPDDEKYRKLKSLLENTSCNNSISFPNIDPYETYITTVLSRESIPETEKCTILCMNWDDYMKFWRTSSSTSSKYRIFNSENDLLKRLKFMNKYTYRSSTRWELRFNGLSCAPLLVVDGLNIYLGEIGEREFFIRITTNSTDSSKKQFKFWLSAKTYNNYVKDDQYQRLPGTEFKKLYPSVKGMNKIDVIQPSDNSGLIESLNSKAFIEVWAHESRESVGGSYGAICTPDMYSSKLTILSSGGSERKGKVKEVNLPIVDDFGLLGSEFDYLETNILPLDWYIKYS